MIPLMHMFFYLFLIMFFIRNKNTKTYTAFSIFPVLAGLIELFRSTPLQDERSYIIILLTAIWLFGFYNHSLKSKNLKDRFYWPLWSLLIYALAVLDLQNAIFWVSMGAGILYLALQSEQDKRSIKILMLVSLSVDILFVIFSPELFSPGNHLLVPVEGVTYLEYFLKLLVPASLALKIIALHKSLGDEQRCVKLCIVEIFFLSSLMLYRYASGYLLSSADWAIISQLFSIVACVTFLRIVFSNKKISSQSLLSLLMLNICVYVSLVSLYEFQAPLILSSISIIFLQNFCFNHNKLFKYSSYLSITFIPILMLMGMRAQSAYFLTPMLLLALLHLSWVYSENIKARRSRAF